MTKIFLYIKKIMSSGKGWVLWILLAVAIILIFIFNPVAAPEPRSPQENLIKVKENTTQQTIEESSPIGKTFDQKNTSLGELLEASQINTDLKLQKFAGGQRYDPIQVITNKANTVVATIEPSVQLEADQLKKLRLANNLPEPDFEMYVLNDYRVKVYAFLSQGVAYEASEFGGQVFHILHFTPTDKAGFLNMFPNRYSETYKPTMY